MYWLTQSDSNSDSSGKLFVNVNDSNLLHALCAMQKFSGNLDTQRPTFN